MQWFQANIKERNDSTAPVIHREKEMSRKKQEGEGNMKGMFLGEVSPGSCIYPEAAHGVNGTGCAERICSVLWSSLQNHLSWVGLAVRQPNRPWMVLFIVLPHVSSLCLTELLKQSLRTPWQPCFHLSYCVCVLGVCAKVCVNRSACDQGNNVPFCLWNDV